MAPVNTAGILVATENFTRFDSIRQFACYAGMAPFGSQSGTAIKKPPPVSLLANRKIKVLLAQAALCAVRHDANIRHYCLRKMADGKPEWPIINNIRGKLIHRIFATVRSENFYQPDYKNPPEKKSA